jgi:hypothetical protein
VKGCAAEPTAEVERDARAGASTAACEGTAIGAVVYAHSFVAAETASGLARLPDLSSVAYESLCIWRLPLTVPICFSVFVPSPVFVPSLTGPRFHFRDILSLPDPILLVVLA